MITDKTSSQGKWIDRHEDDDIAIWRIELWDFGDYNTEDQWHIAHC